MPTLAGWFTGEQVPQEIIEQTLAAMGTVLGQHAGQPAQTILPGAGLIAFSDQAYAMQQGSEPSVLDWAPERHTLVYRRPLSGMHALYYIENWPAEGNLLFASEIKALLTVGVPRHIHLAALDAMLRYGFIPAPWTAFKNIYVVPAGSILRWQRAKTVINHATDYHLDEFSSQTIASLEMMLNEATMGLLPPHEEIAAITGGGNASTLSTLLAAQQRTTPFTIASLGYTISSGSREWQQVELIAEAAKRPLLAISGVDQPEFWTATLAATEAPSIDTGPLAWHQLLHTTSAETGARVAISGLGAHILSGTLSSSIEPHVLHAEQVDMLDNYGQMLTSTASQSTTQIWSRETKELLQKEERWENSLHARKLARRAGQFHDKRLGYYYLDLHLQLPDRLINTIQQVATHERMVVRSPYLHAPVFDKLTRLPMTLDDGTPRSLLIPLLVQRYLANEEKISTTLPLIAPMSSLARLEDSEMLRQTLSREALQATGIFDVQAVETLLQRGKQGNIERELVLVFTTQLLCQLFGVELS